MTKFLRTSAFGIVIALCCANTAGTQDKEAAKEMKAGLAAVKSLKKQSAEEMKKAQAAAAQDQKTAQEVNERAVKLARAELTKREIVPLRVHVVISRYEGDKKTSSLPYTVSLNANATPGMGQLRMGAEVPVSVMGPPPIVDGKPMPASGPVSYQHIGTNIDCGARSTDDGRFQLEITVEDKSVYPEAAGTLGSSMRIGTNPVFRTFRATNTLVLRDGQSAQFVTAADRISGEVVKVDVTLTVVK